MPQSRYRSFRGLTLALGILVILTAAPPGRHTALASTIEQDPEVPSPDIEDIVQEDLDSSEEEEDVQLASPDEGSTESGTTASNLNNQRFGLPQDVHGETPEEPKSSSPDRAGTTESGTTASSLNNQRCRWGERCPDVGVSPETKNTETKNTSQQQQLHTGGGDPPAFGAFVTKPNHSTGPPKGFTITARVYTDPDDKLAHFDDDTPNIVLPYWECGVAGSTTSPLLVKHAYFRHALVGSKPSLWSGTEYGPHPQLLIALAPLELVLNSGTTKEFAPGSVILLEDVLSPGHKLKAISSTHQDMTCVLLTLPQHYYHVGKDRVSLGPSHQDVLDPCPNPQSAFSQTAAAARRSLFSEKTRKLLFGTIGLSVSSLVTVFLGKVAPLWLSVGVGGACFITGGTYAAVVCGEFMTQEVEVWYETRRLKLETEYVDDDDEDAQRMKDALKVDEDDQVRLPNMD